MTTQSDPNVQSIYCIIFAYKRDRNIDEHRFRMVTLLCAYSVQKCNVKFEIKNGPNDSMPTRTILEFL